MEVTSVFFFGEMLGDEQLDDGVAILRFLGLLLKLEGSGNYRFLSNWTTANRNI